IFVFVVTFQPSDFEFEDERFDKAFQKAVSLASLFGNSVISIRGHADPAKVIADFLKVGMVRDQIRREGEPGAYAYYFKDGKKLDFADLKTLRLIADLIAKDNYNGAPADPRE